MRFCVRSWRARAGMAVITGAALIGAAGALSLGSSNASPKASPEAIAGAKSLSESFRAAAEHVLPSVVMIRTTADHAKETAHESMPENPLGDSPFGDFFKDRPEMRRFFKEFRGTPQPPRSGVGSGVIIDESGIILTNNHVVDGGKVIVRLYDGREFEAADVKTDPKTDLAVVRIEGAGALTPVQMGDSDTLEIGDWVLALGQPFGLEGSVTAGIISGKGRGIGITDRESFLQTDAAINPGNSGGPLVNIEGELVGINTAISSRSGGNEGIGFAVPINLARWVSQQLIDSGKVSRAFLGVGIQPVTQELSEQFGVDVREGVVLTQVYPDSPAAEAGLLPGDVIVEFAGQKVSNPNELQGYVEQASVGEKHMLTVLRGDARMEIGVVCREQPADFAMSSRHSEPATEATPSEFDEFGMHVAPLDAETAEQVGMETTDGVMIADVDSGSPAASAGLTAGMVITQADRKAVKSLDDFQSAVADRDADKGLLLLVRTAEGSRFVVVS